MTIIENWLKKIDRVVLLAINRLIKKSYCLSYELLIAKLHAYEFNMKSLYFIQDYLSNRKQRIEIKLTYS